MAGIFVDAMKKFGKQEMSEIGTVIGKSLEKAKCQFLNLFICLKYGLDNIILDKIDGILLGYKDKIP